MSLPIVISVGGSLVVPKTGIDVVFLKSFKKAIVSLSKKGFRFIIVVGGGMTARQYQTAARSVGKLTLDDVDWLGIHATRLNGHLMRTVLREVAHPIMMKDPTRSLQNWKESVLIAAGWKPGWSTDYVAVRLAKKVKAKLVINLSNINYVYTKDPNKFKDAKKIEQISWKDFCHLVGGTWDPGMNAPFDPIASKLARTSKITVIVVNGKNAKNLNNVIEGKKFVGTKIG